MSPLAGALVTETDVGSGVVAVLPDTLWPEALATAWAPSPSAAAVPIVLRIVPPLSERAFAAMEMPSASASDDSAV